jgi:hypothetical protein
MTTLLSSYQSYRVIILGFTETNDSTTYGLDLRVFLDKKQFEFKGKKSSLFVVKDHNALWML